MISTEELKAKIAEDKEEFNRSKTLLSSKTRTKLKKRLAKC